MEQSQKDIPASSSQTNEEIKQQKVQQQQQQQKKQPKEKPQKDVGKMIDSGKTLTAEEKQALRKAKKEEMKQAKMQKTQQKFEAGDEQEEGKVSQEEANASKKNQKKQGSANQAQQDNSNVQVESQSQQQTAFSAMRNSLAADIQEPAQSTTTQGQIQEQNTQQVPNLQTQSSLAPPSNTSRTEQRGRTGSFFSYYSANTQENIKHPQNAVQQELNQAGSIKDIALFSRLATFKEQKDYMDQHKHLHPKIRELGMRIINDHYASSNTRCIAMIQALKAFINNFQVPSNRSLNRELESQLDQIIQFWVGCKPFTTGLETMTDYIKMSVAQLNTKLTQEQQKRIITDKLDNFIADKIIAADETIVQKAMQVFSDTEEEHIMIMGGVQLLQMIFMEAKDQNKKFRVIVTDTSPEFEGREMVKRLSSYGIQCTYTLISGISFLIHKVTKVFIGASSVLSNGAVVAKIGTSMMTSIAAKHLKPVVVFSETYKFSDRVNLDAINNNEIGDPSKIANNLSRKTGQQGGLTSQNDLGDWRKNNKLVLLNLKYDLTPAQNINMIICEFGRVPAISVPVVIRESQRELELSLENENMLFNLEENITSNSSIPL